MLLRGTLIKLFLLVCFCLLGLLLVLSNERWSEVDSDALIVIDNKSNGDPMLDNNNSRIIDRLEAKTSDPITEPVREFLAMELERELPEIDYSFWYDRAGPYRYRKNSTCAPYPEPLKLSLYNIYWQSFINANVTFRMFAAYLDARPSAKRPVVRVLVTANQIDKGFPPTHCQLWYEDNNEPEFVEVTAFVSIWIKQWGYNDNEDYPHLLTCPLIGSENNRTQLRIPRTISLVAKPCDHAINSLRVNYHQPKFEQSIGPPTKFVDFGVCLKGMDFPYVDLSERIVEWMELHRLFGVSRVYSYYFETHPKVKLVLDYYTSIGFLEMHPLTQANGMPPLPHYQHLLLHRRRLVKRLNELIAYNDCFYRNMGKHDYMVNVDIDEVIMPLGPLRQWSELIDMMTVKKNCSDGHTALCFVNTYFTKLSNVEQKEKKEKDDLFVLEHTMRYINYSRPGMATKCFHNTSYSLTLHNHFTLKRLNGCSPTTLNSTLAKMHHYREPDNSYTIDDVVDDRSVWRYAELLRPAVARVWEKINALSGGSGGGDHGVGGVGG